jgi:hypothetical protein
MPNNNWIVDECSRRRNEAAAAKAAETKAAWGRVVAAQNKQQGHGRAASPEEPQPVAQGGWAKVVARLNALARHRG